MVDNKKYLLIVYTVVLIFLIFIATLLFGINPAILGGFGENFSQKSNNAEAHFSLSSSIINTNNAVAPGAELLVNSKIAKFGGPSRVDVLLELEIRDSKNLLIEKGSESIAVETKVNTVEKILINKDANPGTYSAISKIYYGNEVVAVSESTFRVQQQKNNGSYTLTFVIASIALTASLLVLFFFVSMHKAKAKFLTAK